MLCSYEKDAEKDLRRLFTLLKPCNDKNKVANVIPTLVNDTKCVIMVAPVKVYGTIANHFLNIGAVLISVELIKHLNIVPKPTERAIYAAYGSSNGCIHRVLDNPIYFRDVTVHVKSLTSKDVPFGIIISTPSLNELGAVLDVAGQLAGVSYGDKNVRMSP